MKIELNSAQLELELGKKLKPKKAIKPKNVPIHHSFPCPITLFKLALFC
jgi:hypothetical protein